MSPGVDVTGICSPGSVPHHAQDLTLQETIVLMWCHANHTQVQVRFLELLTGVTADKPSPPCGLQFFEIPHYSFSGKWHHFPPIPSIECWNTCPKCWTIWCNSYSVSLLDDHGSSGPPDVFDLHELFQGSGVQFDSHDYFIRRQPDKTLKFRL